MKQSWWLTARCLFMLSYFIMAAIRQRDDEQMLMSEPVWTSVRPSVWVFGLTDYEIIEKSKKLQWSTRCLNMEIWIRPESSRNYVSAVFPTCMIQTDVTAATFTRSPSVWTSTSAEENLDFWNSTLPVCVSNEAFEHLCWQNALKVQCVGFSDT